MPLRIEDYALIGDCETAALVGKDGSIDWLCLPRFDSGACFAALLGGPENGRWLMAPAEPPRLVRRRYRPNTLVLETEFETSDGVVTVIDCMPIRTRFPILVRVVEGKSGRVRMRSELTIRFDYGSIVPWVRQTDQGIRAIAGPDSLRLDAPVALHGENMTTVADFTVGPGDRLPFVLAWQPSNVRATVEVDGLHAVHRTEHWWQHWAGQCPHQGRYRDAVVRSLITLKALTFAPTGGVVAAPTTSLPEKLGGSRNWDYRYCWLRDATFTLLALMNGGYRDEARELARVAALRRGRQARRPANPLWPGRRASPRGVGDLLAARLRRRKPVRIGNAASKQFQLDVFGEVIDAMYQSRRAGLPSNPEAWHVELALLDFLETAWKNTDDGIWEVRGPRRHFTHSKMMAWAAFDRAIRSVEEMGMPGPADRWKAIRAEMHEQVCKLGFNTKRNAFVQYYGSDDLDASLLMMPLLGFLPANDRRVVGTVEAIDKHLSARRFRAALRKPRGGGRLATWRGGFPGLHLLAGR